MELYRNVDTAKGEIVSDGKSVDRLMVNHSGDSAIYLRSYPQV